MGVRAALYARYSSDLQSKTSIDDQFRLCHEFAQRQGWTVVAEFKDAAVSGASMARTGIRDLQRAAQAREFDIVVGESLDRFSRDQEDTAGFCKRMKYVGVRVVTVSEGEINQLQIGFKGTMNAMYLQDLADKTRRGLRGCVEAGRSGGGRCYGYRVIPAIDGAPRGCREVVEAEARVVRRIFTEYVAGLSPETIGKALNAEGIAGPRAKAWSPSTIHGHSGRGTGILNNELYVGRLIWNRQHFVKNPDTGKRVARPNQKDDVVSVEVPTLRIISDQLWEAAKARQASARVSLNLSGLLGVRRPKYMFSGLTKCQSCGGGFNLESHDMLVCFNARTRGTCNNSRSISRHEVERRVLSAMRTHMMEPKAFASFCEEFNAELDRLRKEHRSQSARLREDLSAATTRRTGIMKALSEGFRSDGWKQELLDLDAQVDQLTSQLAQPAAPPLRPDMARIFKEATIALVTGVDRDSQQDGARQSLRAYVEKIVIPPGQGLLQVVGKPEVMLAVARGERAIKGPGGIVGCGGGI